MRTITIRTKKKLDKIMDALKASGRRAFYEEMYDFNGRFYLLFYK